MLAPETMQAHNQASHREMEEYQMSEQQTLHAQHIVWRPSEAEYARSRLVRFMKEQQIADISTLRERAAADPAWYWEAMTKHLELTWLRPYDQILDLRRGKPWARWFVGAQYNYVIDAVDKHARSNAAERPAVIWEGDDGATRTLTFRALAEQVNRLASALRHLGIGPGDRIGIFLPMLPETVIATLACSRIGAIFIPLFSGFGAEAVATRLRDGEAVALITADGFLRRGRTINLKATADEACAEVPTVRHCIVVQRTGESIPWTTGRDHWWHELVADADSTCPVEPTDANTPYMIIYTSGTTGKPKGTVHVHAGFPVKAAHDMAVCFDIQPEDRLCWLTDLGWMMGPWAIAGTLLLGATLIIYEGTPDWPQPDRVWQLVSRHAISVLGLTPTVVRALMPHGDHWPQQHAMPSLRAFGSTGEPWNPAPWEWLFRVVGQGRRPILNYSGGTEISGGILGCTMIEPQKPCAFSGPVPGMAADVVDEHGNPVRGSVGELVIRQPWVGITQGFWRDPDRYLATYWSRWPDLWDHGDWALIDEDGFWYILGRSDDTIKAAGKRIGPAEVESAAVAHPAVQEAAAIGVPDPVKGEAIVVFAMLRPGIPANPSLAAEIQDTIAARLGRPLRPERVLFVPDLPRTRNAKLMRRVIRAAYLGRDPGDLSALENPAAVQAIAEAARNETRS